MPQMFELGFTIHQSASFVHVVVDGTSLATINFSSRKVELDPSFFSPANVSGLEIHVKSLKDVTLISTDDIKIEVEWENRKIKLPSSIEVLLSTRWTQGKGLAMHLHKNMNMEECLTQDLRAGGA